MGASDPMLLTLPRPARPEFEFKHAHDFIIPPPPNPITRPSFNKGDTEVLPSLRASPPERMSTPHRGLPPPSAMTLGPEPGRGIPPPLSVPFTGMPEPPRQSDESMRSWLMTKAEEEKRKQEEERTRQESFKLEQRRIEQTMLLDAFRNGVPPQLVPIIFAGIGSQAVATLSVEWLQQYNNSLHAQQQHVAAQPPTAGSPDSRRERLIIPGAQYGPPPTQAPPVGPPPPTQPGAPYPASPSLSSRQQSGPPSGARAPLQPATMPRMEQQQGLTGPVQPPQVQSAQQEQPQASPSIYFHHWHPPSGQPPAGNPPTPSEYTSSPKKRKATTQAQPSQPSTLPPTSEPRYQSSSFIHVGSPGAGTPTTRKRRLSDSSTSKQTGYAALGGKKSRSRGNTMQHPLEDDRSRRRQYPVVSHFEDRSESGSHSSNYNSSKRPRPPYDHAESGSNSPRRDQIGTNVSSRKSSYG